MWTEKYAKQYFGNKMLWRDGWSNCGSGYDTCPLFGFCNSNKNSLYRYECSMDTCPLNEKEEKEMDKPMKITSIKNGEYFQFVDSNGAVRGPVYKRIKGINQSVVKVSADIDEVIHSMNAYKTANVIKVDKPEEKAKKPLTFADLKIGDKFKYSNAEKNGWIDLWKGVFTKTGTCSIKDKEGTEYTVSTHYAVTLVEEPKKQLTFGDMKVGDKFIVTSSHGQKAKLERVIPFKDRMGYWINAKLDKNETAFGYGYEGTVLLDQQEVELIEAPKPVEKKLTIADLKRGEKFKFLHGEGVCMRVNASFFVPNSSYVYLMPSHFVTWATGTEEVERVVEEKKQTTLADLKVGDKFKFLSKTSIDGLLKDGDICTVDQKQKDFCTIVTPNGNKEDFYLTVEVEKVWISPE